MTAAQINRQNINPRRFGPVGSCIYCGKSDGALSSEHIVPLSLGGETELVAASCVGCAEITGRIEGNVTRLTLGDMRLRMAFPSRRKSKRPSTLCALADYGGRLEPLAIPIKDHAAPMILIWLDLPGYLAGLPKGTPRNARVQIFSFGGLKGKDVGARQIHYGVKLDYVAYARMLAKIAHCIAVFVLGMDGFIPWLEPTIISQEDDIFHLVGGSLEELPASAPSNKVAHDWKVDIHSGDQQPSVVVIDLRLFANMQSIKGDGSNGPGAPCYRVVVGAVNEATLHRLAVGRAYPVLF